MIGIILNMNVLWMPLARVRVFLLHSRLVEEHAFRYQKHLFDAFRQRLKSRIRRGYRMQCHIIMFCDLWTNQFFSKTPSYE
jgi:hypothetical protein